MASSRPARSRIGRNPAGRTVPNATQRSRDRSPASNSCTDCHATGAAMVLRDGDRICYSHTQDSSHTRYDGHDNGLNWQSRGRL